MRSKTIACSRTSYDEHGNVLDIVPIHYVIEGSSAYAAFERGNASYTYIATNGRSVTFLREA